MTFQSILFLKNEELKTNVLTIKEQDFFVDLNLNQILDSLVKGKEEYDLLPFFQTPLTDVETIIYRQMVMADLENPKLLKIVQTFADGMRSLRDQQKFNAKLEYPYHKERLFIDAVIFYVELLNQFSHSLSSINLQSEGLIAYRDYLKSYVQSEEVINMVSEARTIISNLSTIKYCVNIDGLHVQVLPFENEPDYSNDVEETFARFKQGDVKDYKIGIPFTLSMNHVEAAILEGVATLNPEIFARMDGYYKSNLNFQNGLITVFDREIQFYIAYLGYIEKVKNIGLKFCFPLILDKSKQILSKESYDLALANYLIEEKKEMVVNNFYLQGNERIIVVSGPNQGGKTTFARTFGQLHYLASLGCPVPGSEARLYLFDNIFTHFEKEENIKNLRGKLEDDLVRIHEILINATNNSVIILNELFSSTTLQDAVFLSKLVMDTVIRLDSLCVWVTFIDELSTHSEQTVSMVGSVLTENPSQRSYKIFRKPADGLAYALAIAEKYHLTYKSLKERLRV